jgi:hypothetical protein
MIRISLLTLIFMSFNCAALELFCTGDWDSGRVHQEFLLVVDPHTGFMWGFEPMAAIGFFNVDDKKRPWSKNFKCYENESSFGCSGGNSVGFSTAILRRFSGILETTTLLKNETIITKGQYICSSPPAKKF